MILVSFFTGTGYSMYFDTSFGKADESAVLKSRILSSKRMQQCLEFYVKMTGSSLDKLIIWIQINDGFENILEMIKAATFQGNVENGENCETILGIFWFN